MKYMPKDVIETAQSGIKKNFTGDYDPIAFWTNYGEFYRDMFDYPDDFGIAKDGKENMMLDVNSLLPRLINIQPASVLEVGCGFGRCLPYVYDAVPSVARVVGIDHSPTMIEKSKKYLGDYEKATENKIESMVANAKELPFKDNEFDCVYTHVCLTHIPPEDIPQVTSEISRVAKSWIIHIERFAYLYEHPNLHRWSHLLPPFYLEKGWKLHEMDMVTKNPEHYTKVITLRK